MNLAVAPPGSQERPEDMARMQLNNTVKKEPTFVFPSCTYLVTHIVAHTMLKNTHMHLYIYTCKYMCNFCARIWGLLRLSLLLRKPCPSPCRLTLLYISTWNSTRLAWCMDWKGHETFNKNDQLNFDLGLLVVNLLTCLQYFRFCSAQWLSIILVTNSWGPSPKLSQT